MASPLTPGPGARVERFLLLGACLPTGDSRVTSRTFQALDRASLEERVIQLSPSAEWTDQTDRDLKALRNIAAPNLGAILSGAPATPALPARVIGARVAGFDLAALLADGAVELDAAVKILWGVAMGLASLHGRGIAHGDLHPGNVLVTPGGEVVLVGLAPGPLSRPNTTRAATERVRRSAAPEWHREARLHPPGDLYSLGLLAYELFTGKPLLPPSTGMGALKNQVFLQKALDRAGQVTRAVPEGVGAALRAMLQLSPGDRPRSELEFTGALLNALPAGGADLSLRDVLGGRFRRALGVTADAHAWRAEQALRSRACTAAAAALRSYADLAADGSRGERQRLVPLLLDTLWETFCHADRDDREQMSAVALSVLRAATALGVPRIERLAATRLAQIAPKTGPLGSLVEGLATPATLEDPMDDLVERVRTAPDDEDALMALALLEGRVACKKGASLAAAKCALLSQYQLYSAAVFHRARDLAFLPGDAGTLGELAALAHKASRTARGKDPTPSPESGLRSILGPLEPDSTNSLLDEMMDDEIAEAERMLGELQDEPPRPASASVAAGPPATPGAPHVSPTLQAAQRSFEEGRALVLQGKVAEAADRFRTLLETGEVERERYEGAVSGEVRSLLWSALLPGWEQSDPEGTMRSILALCRALELELLTPLCERLLLSCIPEDRLPRELERLLNEEPASLPFLHASAALAARAGDPVARARHLTNLGWALLDAREITPASRFFMEAKAMGADPAEPTEGLARVFAFGEALAEAARLFREAEGDMARTGDARERARICDAYLAGNPSFQTGLEKRLELALELRERARAASLAMDLARRALLRGDNGRARALLRVVLANEPGNDEALLHIASLEPLREVDAGGDVAHLRVQLLCREGLFEAAIQQARGRLTGAADDLPIHRLLASLCRQAGLDPSPHLVALGRLALADGDAEFATRHFQEAIEAAADPAGVRAGVLAIPGLERSLGRQAMESLQGA